jgi:hypothetical protein
MALEDVSPQQTFVDGCPVLPKLRCHEIDQSQAASLLYDFRLKDGSSADLSAYFPSEGESNHRIELRLREVTFADPVNDKIQVVPVTVLDAGNGLLKSDKIPKEIRKNAGIYLEEWGLFDADDDMIRSSKCYLFVNKGLTSALSGSRTSNTGPPTIEEIRLALRDNSAVDNHLLDSVEFDVAEIVQAAVRSLQFWNEAAPPVNPVMTTINFPFKELWLRGIVAYLMETAAHNYRRNELQYQISGGAINDRAKDRQYTEQSARLMSDFRDQVKIKKIEINTGLFFGTVQSDYSGLFY